MRDIPGTNHISYRKSDDLYIVVKSVKGKVKHLGSFKTLIGALMIRDYCQANDWKPYPKNRSKSGEKYISYRENLDVYEIVKNINGCNEYFGRYHTLEEAVKWRDYFIANDWDVNLRLIGTPNKNIYFKLGKYRIIKNIDGKEYYFGSFETFEEAEKRVKDIRLKGWEQVIFDNEQLLETTTSNIIELANGKFEIVKTINGVKETFGLFDNYADAEKEVKLLRKCNWDYDIICEGIDESVDGVAWLNGVSRIRTTFQKQKQRNDGYGFNKYVNAISKDWFKI